MPLHLNGMPREREKPWQPLSPAGLASVFREARFPWWIAGGHAIEHFVGRRIRSHADIDVLALRRNSADLRRHLADWDCWVADSPGQFRPWRLVEPLRDDIHDIWCREDQGSPWAFQVMLDESDGLEWRSRRCAAVSMPLRELGVSNPQGAFILAPEVQLFYKAKSPRAKDEIDFEASLPLLSPEQRTWLAHAIERAYGPENIWAERLRRLSVFPAPEPQLSV